MRQVFFILTSMGLLFGCSRAKRATDDPILCFPFGKYYNWTNYELKQLNFRVADNELLIDTTYNLTLRTFKTHHSEKSADYPEIAKFLRMPLTELHDLQNKTDKMKCDNVNTFYIQYDNGTKLDQIKFRGTDNCDSTLRSVYQELKKLKDKYKS